MTDVDIVGQIRRAYFVQRLAHPRHKITLPRRNSLIASMIWSQTVLPYVSPSANSSSARWAGSPGHAGIEIVLQTKCPSFNRV